MNANELLERLRRLADEHGTAAQEWQAKHHLHLAAWHQGQREAYLRAARLIDGEVGTATPAVAG